MTIKELVNAAHNMAVDKGFWKEKSSEDIPEYLASKISLIHAELSEAIEALREPDGGNFPEELADAVIRIADLAGGSGVDLQIEIEAKMARNAKRPLRHGKRF